MSPVKIEILLYHHYTPTSHLYLNGETSKGDSESLRELVKSGFLEPKEKGFGLTEKGDIYVDAIINIPEPVRVPAWAIPNQKG